MSDINSENAVMRERARIREEVVMFVNKEDMALGGPGEVYIKRSAILKIINNEHN